MGSRTEPARSTLAVEGRGLGVRYRGRVALAEFDIEVAAGEIVGVLGPNGAGKSSLLRLLATGRRPTAGTLRILGQDALQLSAFSLQLSALRRRIGIVPDESVHADALTGRENATLFARLAGLAPAEAAARAGDLLARVLPGADADRPVAEYSLGMRRRLVIVEALAHQPALLVLDEPATGLDLAGRELLRTLVRECAARGAAVVLASNDVAEAERVCGRVILVRGGRKMLEGAPRDLIARLGGTTRFELRLRAPRAPEVVVDGVTIVSATAERLVAHSHDGSSPLPALCEAVLRAGATIEAVAVQRPDLADVFFQATGDELSADPMATTRDSRSA
jgi:ABC-2 type transport system ATP-binding protein